MEQEGNSLRANPPRCSGPLVRLGGKDNAALPERIEGDLADDQRGLRIALALEVRPDGRPRVREAFVAAVDGTEPLLPSALRDLPWGAYAEFLSSMSLWSIVEDPPRSYSLSPIVGDTSRVLGAAQAAARRRPVTDERLRRVADLYRLAMADPTVTSTAVFIAEREEISEAAARKLVMRARKGGYLGPTSPGRAGEVDR